MSLKQITKLTINSLCIRTLVTSSIKNNNLSKTNDLHNLKGGALVIGASQTTGTYLMPRMIGLFRQKFPDVSVQLQVITNWSYSNKD